MSIKPDWQQQIAKERIHILFNLAEKEFRKHPERARRYVELARKMGLRYNVRLKELKRRFCRSCNSLLIPGLSSEIKMDSKNNVKIIICKKCNSIYRYPYKGIKNGA